MRYRNKIVISVLGLVMVALIVLENISLRIVFPEVIRPNLALQIIMGLFLALTNVAVAGVTITLTSMRRQQKNDETQSHEITRIVHQLRTPLTTMQWGLDLLLDPKTPQPPNEQTRILKELLERNQYAIQAVNDILTAARVDSRSIRTTSILVSAPGEIVRDIYQHFALAFQGKKITPALQIIGEPLPSLAITASDFHSTIENLIENAIRYTPVGGRVTVEINRANLGVLVRVSDTGIGIAPGDLERVGEKFFRGREAQKLIPTGTGLGIYIVRKIMHRIGGRFHIESELNSGTIVELIIPSKKL